ncbi:sirohydrochlorin ferrochelatase [Achromatium sp. WMS2]|nr:sirohydrochlorin ferrochelatase [Achromatium sp. WMS2]
MDYFPIFIDIRKKPCLLVGGGEVASRKANLLLNAGADLIVVAPKLAPPLQKLWETGTIRYLARPFLDTDVTADLSLIIAATPHSAVNNQVVNRAKALNIPINVVDHPSDCSFIVPSILDRYPVTVAVSTGGASPVLARLIRARLESLIPAAYGRLADICTKYREQVKAKFRNTETRRRFWERILQGGVADRVFSGHMQDAEKVLEQSLAAADNSLEMGEVYLVGAGPGDPDLLTFRALRLMQQADVVVYDRLVAPAILDLTRRDAKRIYAGKERQHHVMRQEDINSLLTKLARAGHRVVRLKGGDPFIFGRGGEEIETLAAEGVPFQVVPGITAASGCAAYAGIPLTHRDYAQSVTFVTGHLKDGTINLNWTQLSQPQQTVVFYMGLVGLAVIRHNLITNGVPTTMPVALVQQGTTPSQKVITGTLGNIMDAVALDPPQPPTLFIVGEVVTLRDRLAWFEPSSQSQRCVVAEMRNELL